VDSAEPEPGAAYAAGAGVVAREQVEQALAEVASERPGEIELAQAGALGKPEEPRFSLHRYASSGDATPPQSIVDGGGIKMVDPQVQLVFWGAEWTRPSPPTSPQAIEAAVQTLCRSVYFDQLSEYGWFEKIAYGGSFYASTSEPPAQFVRGNVQALVTGLVGAGQLPKPNSGNYYDWIYVVLMPSTTVYQPGGLNGEHSVASWTDPSDNVTLNPYVAWILNGTLDQMTVTISHELAETISDPRGNGIQLSPASPSNWNEVGDVCASVAYLHGVAVQAYWSQTAGACVIPWSQGDSLFQNVPAGESLQVIATQLNYSRELEQYWIGQIRAKDAGGRVYDLYRGQAAGLIASGANSFYVVGADGSRAAVEVGTTGDGHAYLHTHPDASTQDNLLALPHFG
jgi:hypothetical protein